MKGRISPYRVVGTVLLAVIMTLAVTAVFSRHAERAYPERGVSERRLYQGLDSLAFYQAAPIDTERARAHFDAVLNDSSATPAERDIAAFARGWALWAQRTPPYEQCKDVFEDYVAAHPDSPFLADALYILGLAESFDAVGDDPGRAVFWLSQVVDTAAGAPLAAYASSLVANLYREELHDEAAAADWYERAYDLSADSHLPDERLGFLYLAAKMRQRLGRYQEAEATYKRILGLNNGRSSFWTDRVLDRLDELGARTEEYAAGVLTPDPFEMKDYHFEAAGPVTISVSFWIYSSKIGMKRGIDEIIERYESRTPGVDIQVVDLPYLGYMDWMQGQILGKEIPDIVQLDNGSAIRYGAFQGKLLDTSRLLDRINPYTGVKWSEMYYPQFVGVNARDPIYQKNWIISWASETTAFFYNKDAFREAGIVRRDADGNPLRDDQGKVLVAEPQTFAELLDAFAKLREAGRYGEVCSFLPKPASAIWQLPYLQRQFYDNILQQCDVFIPDDYPDPFEIAYSVLNGQLDLRSPELAEPWRLLYEKSRYWLPGGTSLDLQDSMDAFAQGRAASIFWVSTDLPSFEDMCPFEVGVFAFPLAPNSPYYDGPYAQEFTLSAFEFAIPKVVEERGTTAACVDFLQYFTSPEAQAILSREAACASPIKGMMPPAKMAPFLKRTQSRGTYTLPFDPYSVAIVKEPFFQDGWDKLWNEYGRLVGTIPNYDYYRKLADGTESEYEQWRRHRLDTFLANLQDYFTFAYDRMVREYPEDLHREVQRAKDRWMTDFRELYVSNTPLSDAEKGAMKSRMNDAWRSITDNLGLIARCKKTVAQAGRPLPVSTPRFSVKTKRAIASAVQLLLLFGLGAFCLNLLWRPAGVRLMKDFRYIAVLLPTILLLALFSYSPALSAVYHAFFRWNGSDISEFIGMAHFRAMLTDTVLHKAAVIMLIFLAANILKLIPTILVAILLFHLASQRWQYLFRIIFVLPMAVPGIVGLLIWKYFYRMDSGLLNWVLMKFNLIDVPLNWLGDEATVVPSLLLIGFPWVSTIGVLIFLAGLQNISRSVFEAAYLDGCGVWRTFWEIELPLVMGQVKLNVVLVTIATIQDFWLPLVLTNGGPNNASMLPGLWMYQNAFSYGKMGYAAALGVLMFLMILMITYVNMRLLSSKQD